MELKRLTPTRKNSLIAQKYVDRCITLINIAQIVGKEKKTKSKMSFVILLLYKVSHSLNNMIFVFRLYSDIVKIR